MTAENQEMCNGCKEKEADEFCLGKCLECLEKDIDRWFFSTLPI
ncbi:hypothetical protein C8J48_3789 [Desmospora activa DSM 45169]|uniref:Uncharacterized protein n=1 Tax=Desmospora activa DSM 45169 TaxID=1121389 RepID=A0A2T4YXD6_9BACL|nr:hypothetical protein C8J48_3789 [Desmospora activa DSM 45169]